MCDCGNCSLGFDCAKEWEVSHPGNISYSCEFCGLYQASAPKCNVCVESNSGESEDDTCPDCGGPSRTGDTCPDCIDKFSKMLGE